MLCQQCKERDAVLNLTHLVGDAVQQVHLCEKCAAERGLPTTIAMPKATPIGDFLSSVQNQVAAMPGVDLESLDRLWVVYSRGRFGFSVQGRLLRACSGQWERLWPRLGWKLEGRWTRYPGSFTWSLQAPEGHMPLVNQLRGVRLMDALLTHPTLAARTEAACASGG